MHVFLAGLVLTLALFASVTCPAAEALLRSVTLRDCLEMAIGKNLDLQIQRVSTEASSYSLSGAYGAYSPVFLLRAQRDFVSQPGNFDAQKNNPDYPYELTTDEFSSALAGRLPFGLSYDFSAFSFANDARTDFSSSPGLTNTWPTGIRETNNYTSEARVTVQQHLLRDFWYNQDRLNIVLAGKNRQISQQVLRLQLLQTVLSVELAYYDLVATRGALRAAEKSVQLRAALLKEIRRRVDVGDLPPPDMGQAEAEYQNSLTDVSTARERAMSAENLLKSLITDDFMGLADTRLDPAELTVATPPLLIRSESFQQALKNRPDLAEARLAIQKSHALVQFRFNQLFPAVDLVGRYGGLGVSPDRSSAMQDAMSFQDPVYYYGVVVSMPLGNVRERSDYRASKAQRQMAELQLKKAEQAVLVTVADWVNRVQNRYERVSSTRMARQFAAEALTNEERKLQNGLSTSFFVLDFQEKLFAAETAEVEALAEYNKALAHLAFAEASSLEKHSIALSFDSRASMPQSGG